jgi:hypothetical protein
VFVGHREVYKVEVYARVRRAVQVDGMSIRQAAREFGLARKTIRRMLAYSVPVEPGQPLYTPQPTGPSSMQFVWWHYN